MPDFTPTFADLCSAIADGGVLATLDGAVYEVNAFELRRYFQKARILPGISSIQPDPSQEGTDASYPQSSRVRHRH